MIKNFKSLLMSLPLVLVACAGSNYTSNFSGQKWEPIFIEGTAKAHKPNSPEARAFIEFSNNGINGLAGDNLFKASFTFGENDKIENLKLQHTSLQGANAEFEKAFLDALNNTAYFNREADTISLYSREGKILMQLAPLDAKQAYKAELKESEAKNEFATKIAENAPKTLELANTKWEAIFVLNAKDEFVSENGEVPFIEFRDGNKVNGMSGVNNFNGNCQIDIDKINFGNMGFTRKMGLNMTYEKAFLDALKNTARAEIKDENLQCFDADNNLVLEFKTFVEKAKAKKSLSLADTKWQTMYISGAKKSFVGSGDDRVPFIEFKGDDSINGFAGDNVFNGGVKLGKNGSVKVGNLALTMMMGANGEYEQAFMQALNKTAKAEIQDMGFLCLFDKKGKLLMHLKPIKEKLKVNPIVIPEEAPKADDKIAQAEANQKAQELKAQAEAKAKADEIKAKETQLKLEQEAKEAELKAKAKAEQEAQAKALAAAKTQAEAEKLKAQAEAQAKAQAEKEAKLNAEQEAKAKALAQEKAELEAKEKAQAEAVAKAQADKKAKEEELARVKAQQDAKKKALAEEKAKAEAEAKIKAEQEEKAKAEAKAKAIAEQKAAIKAQEAKSRAEVEARSAGSLEDLF